MVDGHTRRTNFIADIMAACRMASSTADEYQPGLRGINVTTSFKIEAKALRKLRHPSRSNKLRGFLE